MKAWLMEHRFALADTLQHIARQPLSILLNVLVVGIALSLPLAGFTLLKNLQPVTSQLASDPEISIFLTRDMPRDQAQALGSSLQGLPAVADATFVPRETALARLKEQAGIQDILAALEKNPLPDAWIVRLRTDETVDAQAAQTLAGQLRQLPGVEHVQIDSAWVQRMEALVRFLRFGLSLLAFTLSAVVIAVIFNTIRLQVLTQREEIEVIKLIGATNRFIRRPFYYMGATQGLAGGCLALVMVWAALLPLNDALGDFARLYGSDFSFRAVDAAQAGLFLAATALLGWLGASLSVSRHLSNSSH